VAGIFLKQVGDAHGAKKCQNCPVPSQDCHEWFVLLSTTNRSVSHDEKRISLSLSLSLARRIQLLPKAQPFEAKAGRTRSNQPPPKRWTTSPQKAKPRFVLLLRPLKKRPDPFAKTPHKRDNKKKRERERERESERERTFKDAQSDSSFTRCQK